MIEGSDGHYRVLARFDRVECPMDWYFSADEFNRVWEKVEDFSTWEYGGGAELLLFNVQRDSDPEADEFYKFDLSKTIVLDFDQLKDEKVTIGVSKMMEKIFRHAKKSNSHDPLAELSNLLGLDTGAKSLKKVLLSLFPRDSGQELAKLVHLRTKDFARQKSLF